LKGQNRLFRSPLLIYEDKIIFSFSKIFHSKEGGKEGRKEGSTHFKKTKVENWRFPKLILSSFFQAKPQTHKHHYYHHTDSDRYSLFLF
jgi:hypothetical protein